MLNELNAIRKRSTYYENPVMQEIITINDVIYIEEKNGVYGQEQRK